MKLVSKIEKIVRNFYFGKRYEIKTTGELDKKIIDDALPAYEQSLKSQSVSIQPDLWRIIMRSKIVKLTAAAVILLAIILGINFLGAPIDGASTAFAAAMDGIKQARTFSCIEIKEGLYDDNGTPKKFQYKKKIMFKEPNLERQEELTSPRLEEEGRTIITNYSSKQALTIIPAQKTAELQNIIEGRELNTNIREWLIKQTLGTFDDLGDVDLNGQIVHKIRSTDEVLVYTIWVDPKTNYPVQIELKLPEQNFIPILYTSIQIDNEIDDKLFSLEPPKGYDLKVIDIAERENITGDTISQESGKQKAFLSINDILDKWEAGYDSIHSMEVKYTMDTTLPDPEGKITISHNTVERIQDGCKFYIKFVDTNPDFPRSEMNLEAAFDGDISTFCNYRTTQGHIEQGIATNGYENVNMLEQYMLLSRYYEDPNYPDGQSYLEFWVRDYLSASKVDDDFKVNIRPELETILGEKCHVIEIGHGNEESRIWLAHNKGMCPMKYEVSNEQKVLICKSEALKIAKVITDVGEVWYPCEVEQILVDDTINLGETQTHKFSVQEFIPYITDIPTETFRVKFPAGTRVVDKIKGISYIQKDTGNNADNKLNDIP